jgi:hypothetical protein
VGVKSVAAIIAASLVAGFVLGGMGIAGAGPTVRQCEPSATMACDSAKKSECGMAAGDCSGQGSESAACGQGSCP